MDYELLKSLYEGWHSLAKENPNQTPTFKVVSTHSLTGGEPTVRIQKEGDSFDYKTIACSDNDELADEKQYYIDLFNEPIDPDMWRSMVLDAIRERIEYLNGRSIEIDRELQELNAKLDAGLNRKTPEMI